jgi:hypothetical protein
MGSKYIVTIKRGVNLKTSRITLVKMKRMIFLRLFLFRRIQSIQTS